MHQELSLRAAEMISAPAIAPPPFLRPGAESQPDFRRQYKMEGSAALERAALRVRRLLPAIASILHQEGVPQEFAAVVLVESGGLPAALSSKGARGLWQLMPGTARRYGLVVNEAKDDRLDLEKSTRAAARYLRDLRAQFGDLELALAGYNAGEQALARALPIQQMQQGISPSATYAAARMHLPAETRAYVPAVMSAMELLTTGKRENPAKALVVYAEARF
jgi:membrane-bound lytic murein transglycosylase D